MKKYAFLACFALISSLTFSQRIVNKVYLLSFTASQIDSILQANGIPNIFNNQYDIDVYRLIYNTVSYDSSATTASGMMAIPRDTVCRFPMAAYYHGTETGKTDAPSFLGGQEPVIGMVLASIGYVVSEPDYLGLGVSPGISPYQHSQTEASTCIDMLRAIREFCDSAGIHRNGQLFLMGYSQGGHACMATHRTIQNQLKGEFTVTAAAPMSGAYDMSGTMVNTMLSDTPYPQPGYLADLIVSWGPIYHLYDSLQQAFVAPYDTTIPPLLDGNHNIGYLNNAMPSVPKLAFTQSQLDTFIYDTASVMRKALEANDVYDWLPQAPVKMLFCKGDHFVPYLNSVVAINKMRQNGCRVCDTLDVNPDLDHEPCAEFAILNAKAFFDQFSYIDCGNGSLMNGLRNDDRGPGISIYPVPARDLLNVEVYFSGAPATATMLGADGRIVQSFALRSGINQISLSGLSSGVYLIKVCASDGLNRVSKVIVE